MKPERWKQIDQLFSEALSLDIEKRKAFLDEACSGDESLRKEIESLLQSDKQSSDLIHASPGGIAADFLTPEHLELGPYRILSKLGAGGMGEIYVARDSRLDRDVAVKILPDHLKEDPNSLKRFEREAKSLAALSHPNILAIYDVGTDQGFSYVVTEYLKGDSLRQVIERGRLPWQRAVAIAIEIAEGLSAAHSNSILHRDLKPENIFITKDGHAKILDFGLARHLQKKNLDELSQEVTESKLTDTGIVAGTVPYMSPEQLRGDPLDARSDIFSMGCVLYEMVTAQRPFARSTSAEMIAAILKEDPVDSAKFEKDIPQSLSEIVKHSLEKDPDQRFQSARDLSFALKSVLTTSNRELKATSLRDVSLSPRKALLRIAAVVFVITALAAALNLDWLKARFLNTQSPAQIQSLAVLPLKNLAGVPEQEYIADAMTEELITAIARIESLNVISRTSVMEYKGARKSLPAIAKELKVDAIVEGSVLLVKNRIRITAQLIHAPTDRHLWAQSYDRDLGDILSLQNEVALSIANEIQIKLSPEEKSRLAGAGRVRPDAYQAYLRGRFFLVPPVQSEVKPVLAVQMFERAVELDPQFAIAYAELSRAHSASYYWYEDRSQERLAKARSAVDRAFQLKPGLPEAHLALGYYYYAGYRDYERAVVEYSIAEKLLASNVDVVALIGSAYRRKGNFQAAVLKFKRAFKLSPREVSLALEIGGTLASLRKYSDADQYFDIAISLAPDKTDGYDSRAINYMVWKGETREARAILDKMPERDQPDLDTVRFNVEACDRNWKAALESISALDNDPYIQGRDAMLSGVAHDRLNQPKLAHDELERAIKIFEKLLTDQPDNSWIHMHLGVVYAYLGRKEQAIREGKTAVDLTPLSKDAVFGPEFIENLAWIYTLVGEYDSAIEQLEHLLSIPSDVSVALLRIDFRWDPLRTHARFQKLLIKQ